MTKLFYINDFEGPLDLLLHLVRTSKMDIYEIDTTKIIEEYLEYIHEMESLNIDIASEYLVMAATLVHLKSKILINQKDDEESNDEFDINSEDDLKKKIIEYERYKSVTEELKELEYKRSEVFTKEPEKLDEYVINKPIKFGTLSVGNLLEALNSIKERKEVLKPLNTKIAKKGISVEQRVKRIKDILDTNEKVDFLDLFDVVTNEYIVVTFLAILQMSKNNELLITQEDNFSPIIVEKRV